jgi:hypothetical protein
MRQGVIPRPTAAEQVQNMSEQEIRQRLTQMLEATKVCSGFGGFVLMPDTADQL